eukprot:TRINITY_DN11874_c0_g2_i1.p1 TRINITY_DN11874_c0_g2~~TRINITY_DN11874_c0_g2_i1.p1  ORF type:complete len:245 (+),score=102.08 TRINITY_DN11874_c0_g2_i1:151-885(+)
MVKIAGNQILPLIYKFLFAAGFEKIANKLAKTAGISVESIETGLGKCSLKKILKYYVKHHPALLKELTEELQQEEVEEQPEIVEEEVEKTQLKKRKKSKENGEAAEEPAKKSKKKKKKVEVEEEEEEAPQPEVEQEGEEESKSPAQVSVSSQNQGKKAPPPNKPFSRVDPGIYTQLPEALRDNTFWAKARYGAGDEFGMLGHTRLKDVRGKDFKKEKTKMKNKAFQGGAGFKINANADNSIPIA